MYGGENTFDLDFRGFKIYFFKFFQKLKKLNTLKN